MSRSTRLALALGLSVAALPLGALAQGASTPAAMVQFGASMHAAARACFDYSDDELRRLKKEQQGQAVAAGMSPAEFEATFAAAFEKARVKFAQASPADKEKACQQLKALGGLKR